MSTKVCVAVAAWLLTFPTLSAAELKVLAWNVESGNSRPEDPTNGSDPRTIAEQLKQLAAYDIVGLEEARPSAIPQFVDALSAGAGERYRSIHSATGMDDRLVIAWRTSRIKLLDGYEINSYGDFLLNSRGDDGSWRHRSPLVARFKDCESALEFLIVVNHLARGDESVRNRQAIGLRNWAAAQSLPVITMGDFNFDWQFGAERGNPAFDEFTRDGIWKWVRPAALVDSNWADVNPHLPVADRTDAYPDSMLDFVFVAGPAKQWQISTSIVVREGDFPDSGETSDHRPIAATITLP